jgi:hypothetical protein
LEQSSFVDNKTGCSDLIIDQNNAIMYAFWKSRRTGWSFSSGGTKSALYKSVDSGKHGTKSTLVSAGQSIHRIAIAVSPSNSNILYSVLETEKAELNGLYRLMMQVPIGNI